MWTKIKNLASLYRELGPRWTIFRLAYAFRLRTGLIRLQMPQSSWASYRANVGARSSRPVLQIPSALPPNVPWNKQTAVDEADKILNGEIKYYSHNFIQTGFPPNWHKDYFTNHVTLSASEGSLSTQSETLRSQQPLPQNDMFTKHWSQISDDHVAARRSWFLPKQSPRNRGLLRREEPEPASQRHVDIKFVWEPNRFAFAYTLVRAYAASHDEKYPEAFWTLIEDWAQHNHPNTGPNWMDGQEIALRLMAWTFGYNAFIHSPSTTSERKSQFTLYVAAQTERIYKNIDYAISTRSNHTISEAAGLWIVGLLFPELKDAKKYFSLGRKLLEREAAAQIFPDGSYSMYSLNYHRFVLQIYLYVMRLGELNQSLFTTRVYHSVEASINYLSQLINPQTGEMPVYGSNDGALVLPLNNCDFTDYRPLLQLGWYITKGERLFEPGPWDEDVFWLYGAESPSPLGRRVRDEGETSFPDGGVYLLRNTNSHALIRCTDYTSRPSHADQLHVDLWIHGHNIAVDAGTYLYSGEGIWRNGLARTSVHNTVTVDNKDQMTMLSRFTWINWSKGKVLKHDQNLWQGEHDGYKPIMHKRTVMSLEGDRWLVIDNLAANETHHYRLHWLLADSGVQELATAQGLLLSPIKTDSKLSDSRVLIQMGLVEGNGNFSLVRADPNSTRGWRSRYYGHKEPAISLMLEANQPQVTFWTFFGFENDVVEVVGNELKINSKKISLRL
ncbi:MAG: alginate lyase family protein [Chloroflexota bacterium]